MGLIESLEPRVFCARADAIINADWRFERSDVAGASAATFNDSSWGTLSLPHSWNAGDGQDGGGNYYRGPGWYRKSLFVDGSYASKRTFLKFDGASLVADVYLNGSFVGQHKGGFSAFTFDVTPWIQPNANNIIAVKVDNGFRPDVAPLGGQDFNVNGGIYRDVHLIKTDPVHINLLDLGSSGVFLKQSRVSSAAASLAVTTEVRNDAKTARKVTVVTTIRDHKKKIVRTLVSGLTVLGKRTTPIVQATRLKNPRLWNGTINPYQYRVNVQVLDNKGSVDDSAYRVGFRSMAISPTSGFYLNGQPYDLHGMGFHQDRLSKGWAVSPADITEDVSLIKEIGATMMRLAHYPHSQTTLDLLDANGIVAWSEIPLINITSDSTAFAESTKQQLREMIRQNYNHPSILFWGLFNEIDEMPGMNELVTSLDQMVWEEDPTRVSVVATDLPNQSPLNWLSDTTGFNQYWGWYYGQTADIGTWADNIHIANPRKLIALSEYGAGGSINQHELNPWQPAHGGDWHPEEYQSSYHEITWNTLKTRSWLWAKLGWNMFDFASDQRSEGDTDGRNDKGLVTYDRKTKKDAFYWYKANWTTAPFNYITSRRWTDRTAADTEVKVYSNLDNATLKINGQTIATKTGSSHIFKWNVKLNPGTNIVEVTSVKDGKTYSDSVTWSLGGATPSVITPSAFSTRPITSTDQQHEEDQAASVLE